jgi:hypothetical protein
MSESLTLLWLANLSYLLQAYGQMQSGVFLPGHLAGLNLFDCRSDSNNCPSKVAKLMAVLFVNQGYWSDSYLTQPCSPIPASVLLNRMNSASLNQKKD